LVEPEDHGIIILENNSTQTEVRQHIEEKEIAGAAVLTEEIDTQLVKKSSIRRLFDKLKIIIKK